MILFWCLRCNLFIYFAFRYIAKMKVNATRIKTNSIPFQFT